MKYGSTAVLGAALLISGCVDAGSESPVSGEQNASQAATKKGFKLGESVNFDAFEVTIKSVKTMASVGGAGFDQKAADGGTLVAVTFTLKNTGKKPLNGFERPSLSLIDGQGNKYSEDVAASIAFRIQKEFNAKSMSDLNPGIRVNDGAVWEVSKEQFNLDSWKVVLDGHEDYPIDLK